MGELNARRGFDYVEFQTFGAVVADICIRLFGGLFGAGGHCALGGKGIYCSVLQKSGIANSSGGFCVYVAAAGGLRPFFAAAAVQNRL